MKELGADWGLDCLLPNMFYQILVEVNEIFWIEWRFVVPKLKMEMWTGAHFTRVSNNGNYVTGSDAATRPF